MNDNIKVWGRNKIIFYRFFLRDMTITQSSCEKRKKDFPNFLYGMFALIEI